MSLIQILILAYFLYFFKLVVHHKSGLTMNRKYSMLDMSEPTILVGFLIGESMEPEKSAAKAKKSAATHADGQTMREKTEQGLAGHDTPSRRRRFFRAFGKPFRPIGRALIQFERFKPVHIIGLIIVPRYFRNSWQELRLVTWPSRRESRRLTSAVLIFAVIFGVLIAAVDYGLDKIFKKVVLKQ
jgi:preprotein translocase SecE subunit